MDAENLITANFMTIPQGASSSLIPDLRLSQDQPGDSLQVRAIAKYLQGLFPVLCIWGEEAKNLKNNSVTTGLHTFKQCPLIPTILKNAEGKAIEKNNVQLVIGD